MNNNDELVDSWKQDFRDAHDSDPANASRQAFEDYWSWAKVFLVTGGAGRRGWLDQGDEVLHAVRQAARVEELRVRIRTIGKRIAAEWAKQARHRRVHSTSFQGSPNLLVWAKRLQRAAADDVGDGAAIEQALTAIEGDLRAALDD